MAAKTSLFIKLLVNFLITNESYRRLTYLTDNIINNRVKCTQLLANIIV